jgi:hypothetical protein
LADGLDDFVDDARFVGCVEHWRRKDFFQLWVFG